MKRAQERRELLFDIWRDKESSSLKSENNVKVKYTYCSLSELKNRLIGHKNRHISHGRPQNTIQRINETKEHEPSNSSTNIPDCTPTKKIKLSDDNDDLPNAQTDIITNFKHEELMSKLREKLMENVGHWAKTKKTNIMGVFYLLMRHLIFVAEPSPEIIADIKVITMEKFYEEGKKYINLVLNTFMRQI
ncbi:hypothetical protein THOM_2039 [Trachipleistophora hominis]|uniref:Uncharacterized protein n=1 Tax=Trachipleistophora hominis TaxID=72359 RepID=L7JW61_TRAHO|nr:hypothetical protein THOM_2039 [Trachipleistophora hominis]